MMTQVILLEAAEADLSTAECRYGECHPSLGADFLLCVEETLDRIAHHPLSYPRIDGEFRKALVRRFPFGVIYQMANGDAVVVAIQHASRHPETWRTRDR
jgi:plasmid stabilization system protein ParE